MKEIFLTLLALLAPDQPKAVEDITLFFDTPTVYFEKYKDDLSYGRGIEDINELELLFVLNDTLNRYGVIIFVDYSDDLEMYLEHLPQLNGGKLQNIECISKFLINEPEQYFSISDLINDPEKRKDSEILNCIKDAGFVFYVIDEDNGTYPIGITDISSKEEIIRNTQTTNIKLIFLD